MAAKLLLASAALIVLALSGCSGAGAADAEIGIHNNTFDPSSLTVKSGTQVHFENHDAVRHTATSDASGAFNTGNIAAGGDGHIVAGAAGTYPFHCAIHPSMKGTLIVQ